MGIIILQAISLTCALSVDTLVASFSYGMNKIKLPISACLVINLICTGTLALSLTLGGILNAVIDPWAAKAVGAALLIFMGALKLIESVVHMRVRRRGTADKSIRFNFMSLKFILTVYSKPEEADADGSKTLSVKESVALAFALSIDSLAVGFGAGVAGASIVLCSVFSFALGLLAVFFGAVIGLRIEKKTSVNLSWLSGVIMIALGVGKFFI